MLEKFNAYRIAKEFHWACESLKIPRFLYDQLYRASASIVLNLAEGSGKRSPDDQRRFYAIALGSLRECQAILDLRRIEDSTFKKLADDLGAILFSLTRHPGYRNRTVSVSVSPNSEQKPKAAPPPSP